MSVHALALFYKVMDNLGDEEQARTNTTTASLIS